MQVITYIENGELRVVSPSAKITDLNALALKVVPEGLAYNIVDDSEIPTPDATVEEVKAEAGRRISVYFPDYKQRNYIARQSELDRIETGTMRDNSGNLIAARALTTEEIAELVAIKGVWDWILAVRIASAAIEASPPPGS